MKSAIVTGASSGIGRATAVALARKGYSLLLAARRPERLEQVARDCEQAARAHDAGSVRAVPRVTDVRREDQVDALVAAAVAQFGRVDVMVNNAGGGTFGRVHETTDEEMRWIFDVNYFGVFYGCKAVAPVMIRQGSGHIFNVSSVIGKRGAPFQGAYCATKFALCGLTDALRVELRACGVHVTCVCPGLTATEFSERTRHGQHRSAIRQRLRRMPAETVGRRIADTVGRAKPERVFSLGGRFLVLLSALWPRAADALMTRYHDEVVSKLDAPPAADRLGERKDRQD